jgi:hypothetical protein
MTKQDWTILSDEDLHAAAMVNDDAAWALSEREEARQTGEPLQEDVFVVLLVDAAIRAKNLRQMPEDFLETIVREEQRIYDPTNWRWMTDIELKARAKSLLRASRTVEEFKQRLRDEMDYPFYVSVCISGTNLRDSMVSVMMQGHNGVISF